MSFVGHPFEYDLFVSYAHAETETESPLMRDWSRFVAGELCELLATAINPGSPPDSRFKMFLDNRELVSGLPLTGTLRDAVQRSALLLVIMGPLYPSKSWCLDELRWFFEKMAEDGRDQQHCIVIRIQPLADDSWPSQLRDEQNDPVHFKDFVGQGTDLPIGISNYKDPLLTQAILGVHIETLNKLKSLRKQMQARRDFGKTQPPPLHPVLYLQSSQPYMMDVWEKVRNALNSRAIVNPDAPPGPITNDALLQRQRDLRLKEYTLCDGLVLLRAHNGDEIKLEIMAAYKDRQRLYQQTRVILPWAIVDELPEDTPHVAKTYGVPCVKTNMADWPDRIIRELGLESETPGKAP
jgi:hypothetical protein